jgi:hypothetical protein
MARRSVVCRVDGLYSVSDLPSFDPSVDSGRPATASFCSSQYVLTLFFVKKIAYNLIGKDRYQIYLLNIYE